MSTEPKRVKGHEILDIAAAKALEDPSYHERLMQDPKEVLLEEGLTIADDVELVIHENSPKRLHLVLPYRIEPGQGIEVDLEEIDIEIILPMSPF